MLMSLLLHLLPNIGESYTTNATVLTVFAVFLLLVVTIHLYRWGRHGTYVIEEVIVDGISIVLFVLIWFLMRRHGMTPLAIYKPTVAFTLISILPTVTLLHVIFFYYNNPYWTNATRYENMWLLSRVYILALMIIICLSFFHRTRKYAPSALMCISAYYLIVWDDKIPNSGEKMIIPILISAITAALTVPAYRFFHLESFRDPQRLTVKTNDKKNDYVTVNAVSNGNKRTFTLERKHPLYRKGPTCPSPPQIISRTCWETRPSAN
jgi:hypothetical protein